MHRENIKHIIEHGTIDQMQEMREVFEELVDYLKAYDHDMYKCVEYELHAIAHEGHLGEALAKKWTSKMCNKDGTKGAHWTWEQVSQVVREKSLKYDMADFYATLNMIYSDFYSSKFDTAHYIEMAKDWLDDSDVGDHKLLKYYFFVVCGK